MRKNRAAVVVASLVLVTLLSGIAGTTWGLIRADHEAGNARNSESEANISEADARKSETEANLSEVAAVAARNDLAKANTKLHESHEELLKSSDGLLTSVAWSLLRPLAAHVQPNRPLPLLNDQEIEPLWELASSKDERLRLRFVEIALQDPVSTRRLKDRAAVAFQATVGLDGTRRRQVEELLA